MNLTKRETAYALVLVGTILSLGMLVVSRNREHGNPQAPSLLTAERERNGPVLRRDEPALGPDATNVSEASYSPKMELDEAAVEDAEFAEKVRRIRPPPTATGLVAEIARVAERKRTRRDTVSGPHDTNELVRVLNEIASQPWTPQNAKRFQDTLVTWGAQDPAAALDYALMIESRRARLSILGTLMGNWAHSDANSAHAWALANLQDDAGAFESALRPVFSTLASQDLDGAMRSVWELPAGSGRAAAMRAVVEQAVRDGSPSEMAAYQASIADPRDSRLFASSLAQNWAIQDPMAAAEWASSLSDPLVRNAALGSVVGAWTSDQPEKAAEWVNRLPAGTLRNQQMTRLTQTWSSFDPVGAADWLIGQQPPQPSLDPAIQGLVTTVMRSNPEGAMAWAGAISDVRIRNSTLQQVGRLWMRQNPQEASAYIATAAALPPAMRARLLQGR